VKQGKIYKFQEKCFIIKRRSFAANSNASIIKETLTMRLELLPHEERPAVLWEPSRCGGCCCVVEDEYRCVVDRRGYVCTMWAPSII